MQFTCSVGEGMAVVKKFSDGAFLEYAQGSFDEWCVYITNAKGERMPPYDKDYFGFLKKMSIVFGAKKIYSDFVSIYERTGIEVDRNTLEHIESIAGTYGMRSLQMEKIFTILYMAMISEENKRGAIIGKRIKRLGMHVLLLEAQSVEYAANFMKGKKWREIDALCKERGF